MNTFTKEIHIRDKVIGQQCSPFIIAEMACAHEGRMDLAKLIIEAAVDAGADAVQLEIFNPSENIVSISDLFDVIKRLAFTPDQWKELFDFTREFDIALFTFAYDLSSLQLALELGTDGIKLNSSDLSNPDMIILCAESKLPVTMGTGSSTMMEITEALKLFTQHGEEELVLMHGVQSFPTDHHKAHIRRMEILQSAFGCLVGYADHTNADLLLSQSIDLLAVGMGASVIEKHITHDRSQKGVDHESALNPDEFKTFVDNVREASAALGPSRLQTFQEHDWKYRRFQKKYIVASCQIPKGTVLTRDKIVFLRGVKPGISPMKYKNLLGKKTLTKIEPFQPIHFDDLSD